MRWAIVGLCVLAAACSGQGLSPTSPSATQLQAQAGTELPFQGSFTRESFAVFEPPITLVITGTATGTATQLGRFTGTSVNRVNTTNNTATGTFNLTAANGDQLLTTINGVENEFVPPNVSKVTLNARIVGGTGRFAGATGAFTIRITEAIDFVANTATGSGSFDGTISLNP
jgi:hypothetical protein